tara:strand:- start:3894 stop:4103 length:210 start_codon:yes stop_codon:yes gene_type:complete
MAISPINVATEGYLDSPSAVSGAGLLTVIINKPVTGGGNIYYRSDGDLNFKQEEEEMIIILATFMELIE